MVLRVAGYQMPVTDDIDVNVTTLCDAVDRAAAAGAEILLTPEGSLSGYTHRFDRTRAIAGLGQLTQLARDRDVGLALGTCWEEPDGQCYNQIRFYAPDGGFLGVHTKTLLCGSLGTPPQGEIEHFAVAPLRRFAWRDGITIGGLICNDMWANPQCTPMPDPHLSRQLSDKGARVVFHAVHGGRDGSEWSRMVRQFHESNLRMRARAGGLWIVTADASLPHDIPCSAPSGVVSPEGTFVCRTEPMGTHLFVHDIVL